MKYEIKVEFTRWLEIEADNEDEAFDFAQDKIPTFTSQLEDVSMDIIGKYE